MSQQFYSPNFKNTGAALSVSSNSKEATVYFRLIKQTAWDDKAKKGAFKGGAIVNVKLSSDETAGLIEAVRNKYQYSFYHSFDKQTTTGSFSYYRIEAKTPKDKVREGFGLTIKKDNVEFKVGFSLGQAERLMLYLRFALDRAFNADYAADKKAYEDKMKASDNSKTDKNKKSVEPVEPEGNEEEVVVAEEVSVEEPEKEADVDF